MAGDGEPIPGMQDIDASMTNSPVRNESQVFQTTNNASSLEASRQLALERSNPNRLKEPFDFFEPGVWGSDMSAEDLVRNFDGTVGGTTAVQAEVNNEGTVIGFRDVNLLAKADVREQVLQQPPRIVLAPLDGPRYIAGRWVVYQEDSGIRIPYPVIDQSSLFVISIVTQGAYAKYNASGAKEQGTTFRNWIGEQRVAKLNQAQNPVKTQQAAPIT